MILILVLFSTKPLLKYNLIIYFVNVTKLLFIFLFYNIKVYF